MILCCLNSMEMFANDFFKLQETAQTDEFKKKFSAGKPVTIETHPGGLHGTTKYRSFKLGIPGIDVQLPVFCHVPKTKHSRAIKKSKKQPGSYGDPHISTWSGVQYDFHGKKTQQVANQGSNDRFTNSIFTLSLLS